jgi:MFS family permease
VLLFVLAHFGHHLVTALLVPLLPLIREEFALDYTQSGLMLSAFALSYGISQLLGGWLADRIGQHILVTIGICGVALAGFLVGLSQTYTMMIIFLGLMGVLGGGYHPASPPLISASVEPKKQGQALGFHLIGGSASHFLTPLIAAAIAMALSWRASFTILAVPTIVFGIVFYFLLGRLVDTKKTEHRISNSRNETTHTPRGLRHLVPFIILTTFNGAMIISVISFIPLFVVDHFGVAKESAAFFVALPYFAGLWASPLGGYLSDRVGKLPVILVMCFIAGLPIYLLNLVPFGLGIGAMLVIIGIVMYIPQPAVQSYIIGQTSERYRSTVLGIYFFGGIEGVGVVTPVIGYLIDHFGFYFSFTIVGAVLFTVTLICSIFLWRS